MEDKSDNYCYAKRNIIENADGDHPSFIFANKGQKLLILKNTSDFWDLKVQDVEKKYPPFYGNKEEFETRRSNV